MFRMYSLLSNIINNGRRARGDKGLHLQNLKAKVNPCANRCRSLSENNDNSKCGDFLSTTLYTQCHLILLQN
jgi:hypothetical protein